MRSLAIAKTTVEVTRLLKIIGRDAEPRAPTSAL